MGLLYADARQLLLARREGAFFGSTATIGRQQLYLRQDESRALVREFGLDPSSAWISDTFGAYAEPFLNQALGATEIVALDASAYEGATLIVDMNSPIPPDLDERFDAVIDGGSLEHIFNVPVALANLIRMVKKGGRILVSTPANNLCGHGFYQFSPELMFRAFSAPHGCVAREVLLIDYRFPGIEHQADRGIYRVTDPDVVAQRVGLMSRRAAMLFVHAEKLEHLADPFQTVPQQSDYVSRWAERRSHGSAGREGLDRLPPRVRSVMRRHRMKWMFSFRNRRFYNRV